MLQDCPFPQGSSRDDLVQRGDDHQRAQSNVAGHLLGVDGYAGRVRKADFQGSAEADVTVWRVEPDQIRRPDAVERKPFNSFKRDSEPRPRSAGIRRSRQRNRVLRARAPSCRRRTAFRTPVRAKRMPLLVGATEHCARLMRGLLEKTRSLRISAAGSSWSRWLGSALATGSGLLYRGFYRGLVETHPCSLTQWMGAVHDLPGTTVTSGRPHLTAVSTAAPYPDWLLRLRSVTVDAGMSVYRLGSRAGLSQSHLKKLLTGGVENPRTETLEQLAAAAEKSLEWILHGDEVVEMVEVGLTQPQLDALSACAFLDDSDLRSLLREAVIQFVDARRADPDVSEMLASLQRRREARSAAQPAHGPGAS